MSIAFVAPSVPTNSTTTTTTTTSLPFPENKSLRRSHTFACCPPATAINRRNSNGNDLKRSPTFGLSGSSNNKPLHRVSTFGLGLKRPRRTRTGVVHFEPQPRKNGLIISGYTCIGKTTFGRKISLRKQHVLRVVDLDSSAYSRSPDFPHNYLAAIRKQANERSIVLISTHDNVATRLQEEGYYVALVYPEGSNDNKQEWLRRLEEREAGGRESRLYKIVNDNWELWDEHLKNFPVSMKVPLSQTDYLISVFKDIYKDFFQRVVIH